MRASDEGLFAVVGFAALGMQCLQIDPGFRVGIRLYGLGCI